MAIESWLASRFDALPYGNTDLRIDCPFCKGRTGKADTGHHLHVSIVKEVCHCFRCDYKGTWAMLVSDVDDVTLAEALDELKADGIKPLYMLLREQKKMPEPVEDMPPWYVSIQDAMDNDSKALQMNGDLAYSYVKHRLHPYTDWSSYINAWGIHSDVYGLLVFPVERGWWQYRHLIGSGQRYVSCASPKEDRLYNWQALDKDEIYVAEGIISAAAIGPDAVALCGKKPTPDQLERLAYCDASRITVCLDVDVRDNAEELAISLNRGSREVWIRQYNYGDPASCENYADHRLGFATRVWMHLD